MTTPRASGPRPSQLSRSSAPGRLESAAQDTAAARTGSSAHSGPASPRANAADGPLQQLPPRRSGRGSGTDMAAAYAPLVPPNGPLAVRTSARRAAPATNAQLGSPASGEPWMNASPIHSPATGGRLGSPGGGQGWMDGLPAGAADAGAHLGDHLGSPGGGQPWMNAASPRAVSLANAGAGPAAGEAPPAMAGSVAASAASPGSSAHAAGAAAGAGPSIASQDAPSRIGANPAAADSVPWADSGQSASARVLTTVASPLDRPADPRRRNLDAPED